MNVRNALERIGVTGELHRHGQHYVKVYSVAEIRKAYKDAVKRYQGKE